MNAARGNWQSPVDSAGEAGTPPNIVIAATTSTHPTADCRLPTAEKALDTVADPELPFLTIRDLGILRDIRDEDGTIVVTITPTYSGCPANDIIAIDIDVALSRAGINAFRVELVRAPAWTTDWITPDGRRKLLENGIAPPPLAVGKRGLFETDAASCPHCGSDQTEQISAFGSTACKAHHRCLTCREPFEAFKCI